MKLFRTPIILLIVSLFSFGVQTARSQSGGGVKNPYSLSVVTLKGATSVGITLRFASVDAQRYPLPNLIKELVVEPLKGTKTSLKKFTLKNVALTGGVSSVAVPGFQSLKQLHLRVHVKADGWQDEHFEFDCTVLSDPDLLVESVTVPPQAYTGIAFNVQAVVREVTGQSAVTASVSLKKGTEVLGVNTNVLVPAGGTVQVNFPNIVETISGTNTYTVVISASNPSESTTSNNGSVVQIQVLDLVTTQLQPGSLTYSFESYDQGEITGNTYSLYDHTVVNFWETSSLDFRVSLPSGVALGAIDEISWEIRTTGGTYAAQVLVSPVQPIGDTQKNIEITANTTSNPVEIALHQIYTYSREVDSWVPKDVTSGVQALVLRPDGLLEVTLRLRSGGSVYLGGASVMVPAPHAPVVDSYSMSWFGESGEDPTQPYNTRWTRRRLSFATTEIVVAGQSQGKFQGDLAEGVEATMPGEFRMSQNYPNPFNPATTIEFALPQDAFATLKVYDMLGREVATIASREFRAGVHRTMWNASRLPSGMYIYRLTAGQFTDQKKLMLLK
jgi:hypothetical protein